MTRLRPILAAVAVASLVAIAVLGGVSVWANATALGRRSGLIDYQAEIGDYVARLAERQECRDVEETAAEVAVDDIVLAAVQDEEDPAAFADASARLRLAVDRLNRISDPDVCGPLPKAPPKPAGQ